MTWNNIPQDIIPFVGFVYCITEIDTNMKYIGIKKFWKTVKLKPLKGKKRKRKKIVETDWKTYNSSNKILQQKLENNPDNYSKEIIECCTTITRMKALEAYMQLDYYFNGNWNKLYNEVINLRLRIRK